MVELLVANEKVAGSNPVSRSIYLIKGFEESPVLKYDIAIATNRSNV